MPRILICDDDDLVRDAIHEQLAAEGHELTMAADGESALALIERERPEAMVLDLRMPRLDGLGVLRRLRENRIDLPVIVMTAHGAVDSAIDATKLGAFAYLSKPLDAAEILLQLSRALAPPQRDENSYGPLLGRSAGMRRVFEVLRRLESVQAPTVLITGETGTGKDLAALAIHARGRRRDKPYVAIDCASIPETLIESELFGHERGSFTDARQQKPGLFELAKGGVIFLDEIGEMPPQTQAKLLRAIESRSFRRVGGVQDLALDAAFVAATNRDLRAEVEAGRFREDLFFRLNVVPLEIPPLRDRGDDIALIARRLVEKLAAALERDVAGLDASAVDVLQRYAWPGNIRELRNVIERAIILKDGDGPLRAADLPDEINERRPTSTRPHFELPAGGIDLAEVERDFLVQALTRAHGNQTKAATLLGISRFALRYRLEKHGPKLR